MLVPLPAAGGNFGIPGVMAHDHVGTCASNFCIILDAYSAEEVGLLQNVVNAAVEKEWKGEKPQPVANRLMDCLSLCSQDCRTGYRYASPCF